MGNRGLDFEALLREVGALKEGHFLLASGRHSNRYVEKFDLLRQPRMTEQACAALVEQVREQGWTVDVVAGPTTGGILLAFEVARQLRVEAAYAERVGDGSAAREFRRGMQFRPGAQVLVIDDILTTGGSVRETLAALEREPVEVVGAAVLVDRSGGNVDLGVPLIGLAQMEIATWDPESCPLCAEGVPLVKPGTTQQAGAR